MASAKGSNQVAANEYVNLDRRQSSSAVGRGSMPTPAHHEASSPWPCISVTKPAYARLGEANVMPSERVQTQTMHGYGDELAVIHQTAPTHRDPQGKIALNFLADLHLGCALAWLK
jgi:hypothetical protein